MCNRRGQRKYSFTKLKVYRPNEMLHSRLRCLQKIIMVSILFTGETASFVPSTSITIANRIISSYLLPNVRMGMNNEDHDDAIVPSSKNSNKTRTTKQSTLDVEALQQQYEAMILGISPDSIKKEQKTVDQKEFFEVTCNIPSDLISILKKESLWSSDSYMVHVPTILTSTERKRRLLEIDLLQNLIHNDDETVDQLWSLWYAERDCHENATIQLYAATTYSTDPNTWKKAEQILRQLILQHGIYWVEPVNRLATLYYLQGKYQQSIDLCNVILHVKPWHFGALSGMVGLYIQMNDMTQAKKWSEKRLPSYIEGSRNSNQRRAEWVRNAVAEAQLALCRAEQKLKSSFGDIDVRPPTRYEKPTDDVIPLDANTTSWQ